MSDYLVDANVLVYLANQTSPFHAQASTAVQKLSQQGRALRTCPQSLVEFRVVATRPIGAPGGLGISPAVAAQDTATFLSLFPLLPDNASVFTLWRSLAEGLAVVGKQNHDARFFAAAAAHGLDGVLTFNVGHFKRFTSVYPQIAIVDPRTI